MIARLARLEGSREVLVGVLRVVRRAAPESMVLQRAAVGSIAVSSATTTGSKAPHGGAQQTAPPPGRGEGVKVTTGPASTASSASSSLGQQVLATVVQVGIVIRAEAAAVAAVATVAAAAIAAS